MVFFVTRWWGAGRPQGYCGGSGLTYKEELVLSERAFEQVEELAAKDNAQGCNREQKAFTGRSQRFCIERQLQRGPDNGDENDLTGSGPKYAAP